jgi:predicted MPP superfamily phosphohydrolase
MKEMSNIGLMAWLTFACAIVLAPCDAAEWRMAMLGDTRGERDSTTTGVSTYLSNIAVKIASLSPDIVLVSGDMINGDDVPDDSPLTNYTHQFEYWKEAMRPIFDYKAHTGIWVYPVRGNHENNATEGPTIEPVKKAYYHAFTNYVPLNGPNYGDTNDQVGYSYAFTYKSANIVVADQYFYYSATNDVGYHDLAREWVIHQFSRTNLPFNIFVAHEPIFNVETETPHAFFGSGAANAQKRRDFWNALGARGVQLYLTGHVHNEVVGSASNDYGAIIQLMAGNGGAKLQPFVGAEPDVRLLLTNDTHYGFALAKVHDTSMTIEYHMLNKAGDHWSIAGYTTTIQAVPEPSQLLLLLLVGMGCWLPHRG